MYNKFRGPVPDTFLFGGSVFISFFTESGQPAVLLIHGTLCDRGLYLLSLSEEHAKIISENLKEFYVNMPPHGLLESQGDSDAYVDFWLRNLPMQWEGSAPLLSECPINIKCQVDSFVIPKSHPDRAILMDRATEGYFPESW